MKKQLLLKEAGDFNKYYRIDLPLNMELKEIQKMLDSFAAFEELLKFIGSYMSIDGEICDNNNCDKAHKIGIAYRIIRRRTDRIIGVSPFKKLFHPYKTSKREIQSIIKTYNQNILLNKKCLKIPYRIDFIFEATIKTIEDIEKAGISIPASLSDYINKVYKIAFYSKHNDLFEPNYKNDKKKKTFIPEIENELKMILIISIVL
jgi:hypothetical protein